MYIRSLCLFIDNIMPEKIAEVIESSTRGFVAEVYRSEKAPAFGSWVQVIQPDQSILFGLVSHVEIASFEPNRRAIAFGKTEEELQQEFPQVMELLRTTFRAQVLAYQDTIGTVRQTLPPHPAGIHAFVKACKQEQICTLGQPYDFLRTLFQNPDPSVPVDDLVVAVLTNLYRAHGGRHGGEHELVRAGRALSRLLDDDHERLHAVLRRVE